MKFAHEFKETLDREAFPEHWLAAAIPYSQLKKCLKKVQRELEGLGLDKETLQHLLAEQTVSPNGEPIPLARYNLDHASSQTLRPRLAVFVHLRHGQVVDAALSPASRAFLQKLSGQQPCSPSLDATRVEIAVPGPSDTHTLSTAEGGLERIEVPLVFDGEFFNILQTDVDSLDALQQQEERTLETSITTLGEEVSAVARPAKKFSKSDISRWREIFDLYVDAQVFFSSHELDHGSRSSAKAVKQLVWFQKEVQSRGLLEKFKVPSSRLAYTRFLHLNAALLQSLKFQEINKTAITKILKKFDKRTSLGASVSFRSAVRSQKFLAGNVAKKLCAQLSQEVVALVPRVEDYSCPVCFCVAWVPVRLRCLHVFCVRCVIKMQRENKKDCPLCRDEVVLEADLSKSIRASRYIYIYIYRTSHQRARANGLCIANIDRDLKRFMTQYFKKETDEKQRADEIERGIEIFGDQYRHSSCLVM